ncbi:MAG: succinylglutamate desuccinylase/aspartoacylase family protein [Oceanospirillaceae bacterium]
MSLITSEVDFNAQGKHCGYIRLAHSVSRSAYGWLPVPVVSIKRAQGPKVVVMAGNHGDEYEGQIIVQQLIATIEAADIEGQLILLPMANFPAAQAGQRTSPLDQLNLNRIFPGDAQGTTTAVMANYIETVLLAGADYFIDIHSGGQSLEYLPLAMANIEGSAAHQERLKVMLESLALPHTLLFGEDAQGWFATSAAYRQGACAVTVELGGGGRVNTHYRKDFQNSLLRFFSAVQLCKNSAELKPVRPIQYVESKAEQLIFSYTDGLFESQVELGDWIEKGQLLACIYQPETPLSKVTKVYAEMEGIVVCLRAMAATERGDCLFELVAPRGSL